ncbi:DUF2127 domain-containing protein [Quadrisphaera sp. INWT6]|uniref:DUF2127 domain-containing protein n=1 Tax=Quadrisphaera sp. INWT6 TaxID=2596917 RepID=UPI001892134D|nr:DUF2127 domain-containing protein [Quadrisphaera sp. INWT6]MBF5080978.1 DUF2127 domain-containing protein [Quadrisphaera sp. INWT6]
MASDQRRRRRLPRVRWDLLDCSLQGHRTVGHDVAAVRPDDALVLREDADGLRWHRCLRCDAWLPRSAPEHPAAEHLPPRDRIQLPLRGRPLRDRYVLRLIALDRVVHVVGLGLLAAAVIVFSGHRGTLDRWWTWGLDFVQQHGVVVDTAHGSIAEVTGWFDTPSSHLLLIGVGLVAYAALEATEAVGLWLGRRWAEYLTFVATSVLLVPEVIDLSDGASATGVTLFALNLAVVVYLLLAKRLFGLRGGGRAEAAEREADSGWSALERTLASATGSSRTTGSAGTADRPPVTGPTGRADAAAAPQVSTPHYP